MYAKLWQFATLLIAATVVTSDFSSRAVSANEIDFIETFALASDREAAIARLIPGTEDYFFYAALHFQSQRRLAESRALIDTWVAKFGMTESARRMQTRQVLLEYNPAAPQATIDYLKTQFGYNVYYARPNPDEAAQLPNALDAKIIEWQTKLKEAVTTGSRLEQIDDLILAEALKNIEYEPDFRGWIGRLRRSDLPDTVKTIAVELQREDSSGFGWAPVHAMLSAEQLDELAKLVPSLYESNNFVQTRLLKIRPSDDVSLNDPAQLRIHLEALLAYAERLPESQIHFKAHVLYQLLLLDANEDKWNRERFLKYIALPRSVGYVSPEFIQRQTNRIFVVLGSDYSAITSLPPINDDSALVLRYLEHFFQTENAIDPYAPFINRDYLKQVFATAKILYGIGNANTYYAQLSPQDQKALRDRVELRFNPNNQKHWMPEQPVKLGVSIKNVSRLTLKIYKLRPRNVLVLSNANISTDIDLDGLVANSERSIEYSLPLDRRHVESLDLPELEGRGVWVVDLFGGGQRSRTLIQKGQLRSLSKMTDAGHLFRVINEHGQLVKSAKILLGEREFAASDSKEHAGEILVPYSDVARDQAIILTDGDFASLENFKHSAETYQLYSGFLAEPQSLLAGTRTGVVIRPQLACNGFPVSISNLEEPSLTIVAKDQEGIETTQLFPNLKLENSMETTVEFLVPQRLDTITFTLQGKIKNISKNAFETLTVSRMINVNSKAKSTVIADFYLTRASSGYVLEVLGRNGEPLPLLPIETQISLRGLRTPHFARFATDVNGKIQLGKLDRVHTIQFSAGSIGTRIFNIDATVLNWPAIMHASAGDTLRLAWPEPEGVLVKYPNRLSLTELRNGQVYKHHNNLISVGDGVISLNKLVAGTYRFTDHLTSQNVELRVVDRVQDIRGGDDFLLGRTRTLEVDPYNAIAISSVTIDEKIKIKIDRADASTRVHIVALPFDQSPSLLSTFITMIPQPAASVKYPLPSFYLDGMRLDEEYQYVLARQLMKKMPGNLLPQPGLLINPWELSLTTNEDQLARGGDAIAPMSAAPAPALQEAESLDRRLNEERRAEGGEASYEFLAEGGVTIANLSPDREGIVEIDVAALENESNVYAIVLHSTGSTYRRISLEGAAKRGTTEQRLVRPFDSKFHLAQRNTVRVIQNQVDGAKVDFGDAVSTRVKLYSTWSEAFSLMAALRQNNADIEPFRILGQWNKLSDDQKQAQYALLASHEMHLFLINQDKTFFDKHVAPLLSDKYAKQLIDNYLLKNDLDGYTRQSRIDLMNAAERAILGVGREASYESTNRYLGDLVKASQKFQNPRDRQRRFDTALVGGILDSMSLGFAVTKEGKLELPAEAFNERGRDMFGATTNGAFGGGYGGAALGAQLQAGAFDSDGVVELTDAVKSQSAAAGRYSKSMLDAKKDAAGVEYSRAASSGFKRKLGRESNRDEPALLQKSLEFSYRGFMGDSPVLYRPLDQTRKWAESQFYHVGLDSQRSALVPADAFWLDFLNHGKNINDPVNGKFLSKSFADTGSSMTAALMALAVLDLPLEAKPNAFAVEESRLIVKDPNRSIAYMQRIESVEVAKEPIPLLVGQDIYLVTPSDAALNKPITSDALLINTAYRASVVITNPTATIQQVEVLMQIPQGAVPLNGGKPTRSAPIDLGPYSSQQLAYEFYFPAPGTFGHYGAQVTNEDGFLAASKEKTWRVLAKPESVDEKTWSHIAAWGTEDQVVEYLKNANLAEIDLTAMCWRLTNKVFYGRVIELLKSLGKYDANVWAYSLVHNDTANIKELLETSPLIANIVGPVLNSNLFQSQPVSHFAFEFYEFRPLVLARRHLLGEKRTILNDVLAGYYQEFMRLLAYQRELTPDQQLGVTYYLILQNRVEEALTRFEKIDRSIVDMQIQYDYCDAYLAFYRSDYDRAAKVASSYSTLEHLRWKTMFGQITRQIDERKQLLAGERTKGFIDVAASQNSSQGILNANREQDQEDAAKKLPSIEIVEDPAGPTIHHRNVGEIQINYYLMDIELLFTRKPFLQGGESNMSIIAPNKQQTVAIGEGVLTTKIDVPEELKNRNLVIEIVGAGIIRSTLVYNNSLQVQVATTMGQLQVLHQGDRKPIEAAYVKVYAKHADGSIRFYKDGYTDLRGRFDYSSVSTPDAATAEEYSILVLDPSMGAVVKKVSAPR